ncbi:MAG TPA: serine/threonine-protein kinase [Phototrophicaceae bacterium]|nr:serine/threonine-protein kinase [Phototrophicaceae bacterium]
MIDSLNGQLDRYQLRERIGSGGMARVYKAWDTSLERVVAIKVLHEHLADDPTFKERFEREAKFIAGFNHPNIVQVYDFNEVTRDDTTLYYMVMSYLPGKSLREVLEEEAIHNRKLPRERVREIVADLASALGYAHMRGMVHRDVKPGNVILNEHGRAVLTDFGIARLMQGARLTQDGVSTGTPIYMSPEQANGQGGDARSDLYSLGIMTYEMLTGRPPFVDESSLAVMLKHLNTTPPAPSEFIHTHQFDDFFRKALAKSPENRFQNAAEFAQAFESAFESADSDATTIVEAVPKTTVLPAATTSVFETFTVQIRQHPRTSGAIIVAALGAVLLLILLLINTMQFRAATQPTAPTAAPAATANVDDIYFSSTFDASDPTRSLWSTESSNWLTRQFTSDGRYQMRSTQNRTASTSIYATDTAYSNISIDMVGKLETTSQPTSAYGIVFRYHDENNYNVFAVDGEGRFGIWVRSNGIWTELRKQDAKEPWTPNSSIHPLGQDNDLTIQIVTDTLTGYVNDKKIVTVNDSTLKDGRIGIYFATADGEATVSVDSYSIQSSVPAMTG